jgi:hypothetical protein
MGAFLRDHNSFNGIMGYMVHRKCQALYCKVSAMTAWRAIATNSSMCTSSSRRTKKTKMRCPLQLTSLNTLTTLPAWSNNNKKPNSSTHRGWAPPSQCRSKNGTTTAPSARDCRSSINGRRTSCSDRYADRLEKAMACRVDIFF